MKVGRALLILELFVFGALNAFPLKVMLFKRYRVRESSRMQNIMLSLFLSLIPGIIASFFTEIEDYLSITGSFSGIVLVFLFPLIMALEIKYTKKKIYYIFLWIYLFAILSLVASSSFFSMKKFIKEESKI